MRWKRTAKTASFDLCVDPIDQAGKGFQLLVRFSIYLSVKVLRLEQIHAHSQKCHVSRTARFQSHQIHWRYCCDIQREISDEISTLLAGKLNQIHLAWGLCLMAIGEAEEGERHLDKYCDRILRRPIRSNNS